ncbi:Uncharacterised protein [Paenibacillus macerans]|nr:hypothetical protein DJ90_4659 [Paenibacillus macerans]GBK63603.1 hypothetical protein PbDSM24746_36070 [Paenibacillus macerans]GBK69916.1 hypothetical protein PbJCM17693_36240 [Paenibacillus macerans]SUA85964.1 Uncharacterised protein [Paenibacillus macerans]
MRLECWGALACGMDGGKKTNRKKLCINGMLLKSYARVTLAMGSDSGKAADSVDREFGGWM